MKGIKTVRNNAERLGIESPTPQESGEPLPTAIVNQEKVDLGYTQPTEVVDLPSKGKFYPGSHPLHNVDVVEIRYMTTQEEEILNSKSLLQKGIALDKMLQNLLINKEIKVSSLIIGDKNAVVLAARVTGYGSDYKTGVTCTSCGEKSTHEFNLNDIKPKETPDDVQIADDGTFDLILPLSKAKVTCKMLTGEDEIVLRLSSEKKKRHKLPETPIKDQLKQLLVSVNDDADPEVISKFVNNLLARDSRYIRDEYARIVPNVDLTQEFECPKCGAQATISVPFTADFFWPNR